MSQIQLTDADNGTTVRAAVSDEIEVRLSENPTTGFQWMRGNVDQGMLRVDSDEFVPAHGDIGAGGVHVFRFTVTAAGSSDLSLNLSRGSHAPPAQQFRVNIVARA